MPEGSMYTSGGKVFTLKEARTHEGQQCVVPGFVGGSFVPTSPVYIDQSGADLQQIEVEHPDGVSEVEIWRSINSLDPVNFDKDLGQVPEGQTPDYSNIKWRYVSNYTFTHGERAIPEYLLKVLSKSRYVKIDKKRGADISLVDLYAN